MAVLAIACNLMLSWASKVTHSLPYLFIMDVRGDSHSVPNEFVMDVYGDTALRG